MSAPHFFTVGPSALHPLYLSFYQGAIEQGLGSVYHRSREFHQLYQRADEALRALLGLDADWMLFFADSGSVIWERILLNLSRRRTHHLVNGAFSGRFMHYAKALGREVSSTEVARGNAFAWNTVQVPAEAELVTVVLNETSTGVLLPVQGLQGLKQRYPNNLLAVDAVSVAPFGGVGCCGADTFFFSVQKCFGMPPGLGVWAVHRSAIPKATSSGNGAHHTLQAFVMHYSRFETPSTPNTLAIAVLADIAEDFLRRGPEQLWKQVRQRAGVLYAFAEESSWIKPLVQDPENRSPSTLVFRSEIPRDALLDFMEERGVRLSAGYGDAPGEEIRIGNFPAHTQQAWDALLFALQDADRFFR